MFKFYLNRIYKRVLAFILIISGCAYMQMRAKVI